VLPLARPLLDEITLGIGAGAVVALLLALVAQLRIGRLRKGFAVLDGPNGAESVLAALDRTNAEVRQLRSDVARARHEVSDARSDLADALRHVAVVRYDAFGDMGGRLSFTAALLDDAGDGLVISSINGRTEARSYAKGIKGGRSEATLSPEESQAIDLALGRSDQARTSA
jgi:hypothetical protein